MKRKARSDNACSFSSPLNNRLYHNIATANCRHSSIRTAQFSWLLDNAWCDDDVAKYVEYKSLSPNCFTKEPSFRNASAKTNSQREVSSTWVLKDTNGLILGFGELYISEPKSLSVYLQLLFANDTSGVHEYAVALLISEIFLVAMPSVVRVAATPTAVTSFVLGCGEKQRLFYPQASFEVLPPNTTAEPLGEIDCLSIVDTEWWACELGIKTRAKLEHIASRVERQDATKKAKGIRKPRSLLLRLFFPKVDD